MEYSGKNIGLSWTWYKTPIALWQLYMILQPMDIIGCEAREETIYYSRIHVLGLLMPSFLLSIIKSVALRKQYIETVMITFYCLNSWNCLESFMCSLILRRYLVLRRNFGNVLEVTWVNYSVVPFGFKLFSYPKVTGVSGSWAPLQTSKCNLEKWFHVCRYLSLSRIFLTHTCRGSFAAASSSGVLKPF